MVPLGILKRFLYCVSYEWISLFVIYKSLIVLGIKEFDILYIIRAIDLEIMVGYGIHTEKM